MALEYWIKDSGIEDRKNQFHHDPMILMCFVEDDMIYYMWLTETGATFKALRSKMVSNLEPAYQLGCTRLA